MSGKGLLLAHAWLARVERCKCRGALKRAKALPQTKTMAGEGGLGEGKTRGKSPCLSPKTRPMLEAKAGGLEEEKHEEQRIPKNEAGS